MRAAIPGYLFLLGACHSEGPPPPRDLVNIEIVGAAGCLGDVMAELGNHEVGLADGPFWEKGIGRIEVGPIDRSRLRPVTALIGKHPCVNSVRERPCATPSSDIVSCPNAPVSAGANRHDAKGD